MLLRDLVDTSTAIGATRSRLEKRELLAALLGRAGAVELPVIVAYLSGVLPQGRIGIGPATVFGADPTPAPSPGLTVAAVDAALGRLAAMAGPGSVARRSAELETLLGAATGSEQEFLRRLLVGDLRQGALEGVMVEAIAAVAGVEPEEVRRAVMLAGDVSLVAGRAVAEGSAGLGRFSLELFRAVRPMLAATADDLGAALEATGPALVEVKLDGVRIQVHRAGDRVAVYTRRLQDVTASVPDVVAAVRAFPGDPVILDGEAIVLSAAGRPRPFQVTMGRFGSRRDVARLQRELPLTPFFFDCLHHAGADLLDRPGRERIEELDRSVPAEFRVARLLDPDGVAAGAFLAETLAAGHEGVMVKALDAPYAAGRRGSAWRKVKPAHTLDLVVLAAEWGSGRRHGFLSNIHLGAADGSGGFVMLGKTFKGMTDSMLSWQTERFLELETHRRGRVVYLRPEQVVEVAYDGIQASNRYPGGMALRFARVKGYRMDKAAAEADTIGTVRARFEAG